MPNRIGVRLECKNEWERRVALIPADVADLVARGVEIWVESFPRRIFTDAEYEQAGAKPVNDVGPCEIVLGIKEMPKEFFRSGGAYMFFSHTIKGQTYNMEMLARLVEQKCTLLDYEAVTDGDGRRLIFFGRHAGIAGMIDTLWTLGRRLEAMGHKTPFLNIRPAHRYPDLDEIKTAMSSVGARISKEQLPAELAPMVIGITGYGNVSRGAQEIFDLLPHVDVAPDELVDFIPANRDLRNRLVKVVYKENDLVQPVDPSKPFHLQEYYDHPERYRSVFDPQLKILSVLVHCIYWDERYPKLADTDQLRKLYADHSNPRLIVVGDITCDVDGSLSCTVRDTEPGDPVYVYDPETRNARSGFEGPGLAVMAVGNLPCELPRDASTSFSHALREYIPAMAAADLASHFEDVRLPDPIRRSVILWNGRFTPQFEYMAKFLAEGLRGNH